jgi:hypothetical protein
MRVAVEKPQGWRASLALHFLKKDAIAPLALAVISFAPSRAQAGWGGDFPTARAVGYDLPPATRAGGTEQA